MSSGWRRRLSPSLAAEAPAPVLAGATRVVASDLGVEVDGRLLLDGVNLRLRAGEVVAVVGPNGAGKSTLIAALAGDRIPGARLRGTVELDGRPIHAWSEVERGMRRAVMTQDQVVGLPFSAAAVVRMGRAPWWHHTDEETDAAVVAGVMAATETTNLAGREVTRLSGGERARVAMARCLAQEAGVLLLDEPTAALDLRHQVGTLHLAAEAAGAGAAVLAVMHDLALAARFCDRIVVLDRGRIRADGAPREVLDADRLSEIYGCEVDVIAHPRDGSLLVVPRRSAAAPHCDITDPEVFRAATV